MANTLLDKVWDLHKIGTLPTGQDQLFVGLVMAHESGSPGSFQRLRESGYKMLYPERFVTTVDHVVPSTSIKRPFEDLEADAMVEAIKQNSMEFGIRHFGLDSEYRGIVHVIGPELGLSQPGMLIAIGDSHTPTHGAMGAIAFGMGGTHFRDLAATQTVALAKPKIRRIEIKSKPGKGIYGKDIILKILSVLGIDAGIGFAYEYGGEAIEALSMDDRLTICNMSIEGAARIGYINPDDTTFNYLKGRLFSPKGEEFDRAVKFWRSMASSPNADYDDVVTFDIKDLEPMVTWGINPSHAIGVNQVIPPAPKNEKERVEYEKACDYMGYSEGQPVAGTKIDVAFIGSCTNSRLTDLREAARVIEGKHVKSNVKALVVPGSVQTALAAEKEGLDQKFKAAGFEWRIPSCSMCLSMNPDKLEGRQVCASTSNRNFIGRQGSPTGRTLLMSPAMAAAAAVCGEVVDVRTLL